MTWTIDDIRAGARRYNAEFPEAMPLIEAGEVELRVTTLEADRYGRMVRIIIDPGITSDGHFISAGTTALTVRRRDGRLAALEVAKRATRRQFADVQVPVRWIER